MQLVVGTIGRAHGLRGEVVVDVRTDRPALRFVAGRVLATEGRGPAELVVASSRRHQDRLLVRFDRVEDRTAAEALRGLRLTIEADAEQDPTSAVEDEGFYDHQLIGLRAVDPAGTELGSVRDVLHPPPHDVLVLARPTGSDALIPFVHAIVPGIDLDAGTVTVIDPGGLLDLGDEGAS